jgi:hypothetical protein
VTTDWLSLEDRPMTSLEIELCGASAIPQRRCVGGGDHSWAESGEQKTVGRVGYEHQNQECTVCRAHRCIWIPKPPRAAK